MDFSDRVSQLSLSFQDEQTCQTNDQSELTMREQKNT